MWWDIKAQFRGCKVSIVRAPLLLKNGWRGKQLGNPQARTADTSMPPGYEGRPSVAILNPNVGGQNNQKRVLGVSMVYLSRDHKGRL